MPADPIHHTPTVDTAWDGAMAERNVEVPVTAEERRLWAWRDPDADETTKGAYKFPHHMVAAGGKVGAANVKACTSGVGVLNGGMGGSSIPDKDRQAVYDHLAAHLKDAKVDEIPELESAGRVTVGASRAVAALELLGAGDRAALRERVDGGDLEMRAELRKGMRNVRETRRCPLDFELRDIADGTGGNELLFTGFASVTCDRDSDEAAYEMEDWLGPWVESVTVGAFRKTLAEGADVAFLTNHGGLTMARTKPGTLRLAEVTYGSPTGLHTEARLDPKRPDVKMLRSAVERGDVDEMSFAFRVTRQEWDEDYTRRWITEVNLANGDVSVVNFGANPHTGGTVGMRKKAIPVDWRASAVREVHAYLERERREGKTISSSTGDTLSQVLDLIADADTNLDKAQPLLADLLGVVNPDIAQDSDDQTAVPPSDDDGDTDQLSLPNLTALPDYTRSARARLAALRG